jgi:hypothetical protein
MMMLLAIVVVTIAQGATALTTVTRGTNSAIEDSSEMVARSQAEWEALWKSHGGAQPAPRVDFSRDIVAAVFLGTRRSGGFSVEVIGYRREGSALVIDYVERIPAAGGIVTQALTSPYHIVMLPRFDGPIRFRKVK